MATETPNADAEAASKPDAAAAEPAVQAAAAAATDTDADAPVEKPFGPDDCPKCEECPPCVKGAPAWMATFADMATLLMAFFVLLLSFAEMNVPKFKQINGSLKNAFGVQRLIPVVESPKAQSLIARSFSPTVAEPTPINTLRQETTDDRKEEVEVKTDVAPKAAEALQAMQQALAQEIAKGEAQVKLEQGKVVVEITATPSGGGAGPSGARQGGAGASGASQGGSSANGARQAGASANGAQAGGASANGAQAGGASANGAQAGGATANGAQAGGASANGAQAGGAAARGAKQAGTVAQGEIEFFAKVAEAQAQVQAAVEVRDLRGTPAAAAAGAAGAGSGTAANGSGNGGPAQADAELQRIRKELAKEIDSGKAEVQRDGARIIIRLAEQGSFRSGSADLQPGFTQVLGAVGKSIASTSGRVYIEGHTDNVPVVFNERFRSNWDLSAARSGAVADYLSSNAGLGNARLSVSGYADTRPLDNNSTAAGRAKNRRIEVIVDGAGG